MAKQKTTPKYGAKGKSTLVRMSKVLSGRVEKDRPVGQSHVGETYHKWSAEDMAKGK